MKMSEKDYKILMKDLEEEYKRLTASKEAAKAFLLEADLITPTGRLKKAKSFRPFR